MPPAGPLCTGAASAAAAAPHVAAWRAVWAAQAAAGAPFVSATPEYGPAPYTPPPSSSSSSPSSSAGTKGPPPKAAAALWAQTLAGAAHVRAEHAACGQTELLAAPLL